MVNLAVSLAIPVLGILIWRKEMRKEMIWTGLFAVPILLLPYLIVKPFRPEVLVSPSTLVRVLIGYLLASLAAALYKVVFRPFITLKPHPYRHNLIWLIGGPIVTALLVVLAGLPLPFSLIAGLVLDLIIILAWRHDLVWDVLFSGFGMGALYALIFIFLGGAMPGSVNSLWFTHSLSGLNLLSLPVEELVSVILIGALAGPLYLVAKGEDEQLGTEVPYRPWHIRPKKIAVVSILLAVLISGGWVSNAFVFQPEVVEAKASMEDNRLSLGSPIRIRLNRPIIRTSLKMNISPEIEGSWSFEDSIWSREFFRTIVFTPRGYYQPDTSYVIRISGIKNVFGLSETDYVYKFRTQSVPSVVRASITNEQSNVPVCDGFTFYLNQPNQKLAVFEPILDPPVALTTTYVESEKAYQIKPETCLGQDTVYHLIINRSLTIYDPGTDRLIKQSTPESNYDLYFRTKAAPGLKGFEPQGAMLVPDQIKTVSVLFHESMVTEDVGNKVEISPPVKGNWAWSAPDHLSYQLQEDLSLNTTYKVLVHPGLKDAKGGTLDKEYSHSFSTIGPVKVTRTYPANGARGISSQAVISVSFDQDVEHSSAEQAFSITPVANGSFSWSGRTMKYAATLEKDTRYEYAMRAGVKSTMGGQDSTGGINNSFQTEESLTLLNIPTYFQRHTLSCEVASLKMALGYKGVQVSEEALMDKVGYDPTEHSGSVWGDPDVAFVGSLDGRQNTTGYGVNWGPIARAASSYRQSQAFSGWTIQQAAEQIAKGNPIVIWGIYPGGKYDPWTTPSGKVVHAWKGEHVRTLIGFTGKASNPTSFIINDPISGRLTWSAQAFRNNWSTFGNSGVVVY